MDSIDALMSAIEGTQYGGNIILTSDLTFYESCVLDTAGKSFILLNGYTLYIPEEIDVVFSGRISFTSTDAKPIFDIAQNATLTLNRYCTVTASGENARCVVLHWPNGLIPNLSVFKADGANSIVVDAPMGISTEYLIANAYGENSCAIRSGSDTLLFYCSLSSDSITIDAAPHALVELDSCAVSPDVPNSVVISRTPFPVYPNGDKYLSALTGKHTSLPSRLPFLLTADGYPDKTMELLLSWTRIDLPISDGLFHLSVPALPPLPEVLFSEDNTVELSVLFSTPPIPQITYAASIPESNSIYIYLAYYDGTSPLTLECSEDNGITWSELPQKYSVEIDKIIVDYSLSEPMNMLLRLRLENDTYSSTIAVSLSSTPIITGNPGTGDIDGGDRNQQPPLPSSTLSSESNSAQTQNTLRNRLEQAIQALAQRRFLPPFYYKINSSTFSPAPQSISTDSFQPAPSASPSYMPPLSPSSSNTPSSAAPVPSHTPPSSQTPQKSESILSALPAPFLQLPPSPSITPVVSPKSEVNIPRDAIPSASADLLQTPKPSPLPSPTTSVTSITATQFKQAGLFYTAMLFLLFIAMLCASYLLFYRKK